MSDKNISEIKNEIAGSKRDIFNLPANGIFKNTDETLKNRAGSDGLKIYDDLENDTHASAVLQKRKLAVLARDWEIVPASDAPADVEAAEFIDDCLKNLLFDQVCLDLMDAILKGYAVSEIMWEVAGDKIRPTAILSREPRRFLFDEDTRLRLLTPENRQTGEIMPDNKFIVHRYGGKAGNPYGRGIGSKLYWPVFFKRRGIEFWLVFCEKFGSPTAVGTYAPGTPESEQEKLLRVISDIAQNTAVVIPQGCDLKFLEAVRGGVTTYEQLCRYMDEQISEAVLGETLSTNIGDAGSYAAASTHNDVREEISCADADLLADTLKRDLFRPIVEFNFPAAQVPSIRRFIPVSDSAKDEAFSKKMDWLSKAWALGMEPEDAPAFYAEAFGGQWVKVDRPSMPAGYPSFAEKDETADLSDQVADLADPLTEKWIDQVKALAAECTDIYELRDRLLELYNSLDTDTLSEVMAAGLEVAELTGRAEA